MGFDYGTKRIGIAYGQPVTMTAKPLTVLKNTKEGLFWQLIKQLIAEWRPQALIIGLPLNMDDTEQTTTALAREFGTQLHQLFKLPIFFCDERLSTIAAREEIFDRGGYRALQSEGIDATAAKIILESWMRSNC